MAETQHDKSPPESGGIRAEHDPSDFSALVGADDAELEDTETLRKRGRPRGSGKVQRALDYIYARKEALAKNPHALPVPELDALERILR